MHEAVTDSLCKMDETAKTNGCNVWNRNKKCAKWTVLQHFHGEFFDKIINGPNLWGLFHCQVIINTGQNGRHPNRKYFRMHFREWKRWNSVRSSTEICSQGSQDDKQALSIGSGNGVAPDRRQPITWTNADPVHWHKFRALGGDDLKIHN